VALNTAEQFIKTNPLKNKVILLSFNPNEALKNFD
jgi:hypothetical protein